VVGSHANHAFTRRTTARSPGTDDFDAESPEAIALIATD